MFKQAIAASAGTAVLAGIAVSSAPAASASTNSFVKTSISSDCNVRQISYGNRGALVKAWQWRLNSRYVKLDGNFGPATLRMTKYFQKTKGLKVDGIVGPKTWAAIGSYPGCSNTKPTPTPPKPTPTPVVSVTRYVVQGINFLSVRKGPGTSYAEIGKISSGTKVSGVVSNGWMAVTTGPSAGGYVSAQYLASSPGTPPKPPTPPTSSTVTRTVTSDGEYAVIRTSPRLGSGINGRASAHSRVTGTISGDWLKTSRGYINTGTLTTASSPRTINGRISTGSLCKIPLAWNPDRSFAPGYTKNTQRYLNCGALRGLGLLQDAYKASFGRYAQIDLSYRTIKEQQYWYDRFGSPRAAQVGKSNHGYGISVDFTDLRSAGFNWGQPGSNWLRSNSGKYGFNNPFRTGTDNESYHYNFVG